MIYLDVTSSCKTPRPTGVQRVVRGIFRALRRRGPVVPLVWHPTLETYCRVMPLQSAHLRGWSLLPFTHSWLSPINRHLQFAVNRLFPVALPKVIQPGDLFIQPEIFQDNRIEWIDAHFPTMNEVRKVLVFHDALNWSHPHLSATGRLTRFSHYLERSAQFDAVSAVSSFSAAALRQFWDESRLSGPPVQVDHLALGWRRRPSLLPPKDRQLRLPYVATLEPRKNHFALLDACEHLWTSGHQFELVLVGKEGPGQGRQIAAKIRSFSQRGLPVRWYNSMSDGGIRRLYKKAAFSLYPSLVEGFGLPVLESLWFGAPCLCHNQGAVAEAAQGGGCHLVDTRHVDSLAEGIASMLTNADLRRRLAREAAERSFRTWEGYLDGWKQWL